MSVDNGFRDPITHKPLVVSHNSTNVILRALVAAHRAGVISDREYSLTYAETCEIGYLPQAFGGFVVDPSVIHDWQTENRWR